MNGAVDLESAKPEGTIERISSKAHQREVVETAREGIGGNV
jgi:hypothetical protein